MTKHLPTVDVTFRRRKIVNDKMIYTTTVEELRACNDETPIRDAQISALKIAIEQLQEKENQ